MKTNPSRQDAGDHLLLILISDVERDVERDVEVVARELNLAPAMAERCRRALDRVLAVHKILGIVEADDGRLKGRAVAGMREALALLATEWPAEYPAYTVEWMVL